MRTEWRSESARARVGAGYGRDRVGRGDGCRLLLEECLRHLMLVRRNSFQDRKEQVHFGRIGGTSQGLTVFYPLSVLEQCKAGRKRKMRKITMRVLEKYRDSTDSTSSTDNYTMQPTYSIK